MNGSLLNKVLLNRYQVEDFIGRGGMADVYRVWDKNRAVNLAMKVLREDLAEDKIFLRRFRQEAHRLALLDHPHIVRFYEFDQDGDLAFMLMDYIEGSTLRKEIFRAEGPLPGERILEIMQPVCSALHYSHMQHYVHCDVKPANIMLEKNGSVFLSDFGIARLTESATTTMIGAGAPAYMAPEQVRGENLSPQTDIYALGIVLYEMLTGGERPFTGERAQITGTTNDKVRWEKHHLEPQSPRTYFPEINSELEGVVLKCLQKIPANRYPDALSLFEALQSVLTPVKIPIDRDKEVLASPEGKREEDAGRKPVEKPVQDTGQQLRKTGEKDLEIRTHRWKQPRIWIPALILLFIIFFGAITIFSSPGANFGVSSPTHPPESDPNVAAFSTSGNEIYFTSNREGKFEIYHMDGVGHVIRITNTPQDGESVGPAVKPGDGLYYSSNRSGKFEIYYLDNQGQRSKITHSPENSESWGPAPTSQGGLYFTSNRQGKMEIYYLDRNSGVVKITSTDGDFESWDPAPGPGGGVYFTSNRSGKSEIHFLDQEGQEIRITNTTGGGESFDPSPAAGGGLYFTSTRHGKGSIYYLDSEGDISQITDPGAEGESWDPVPTPGGGLYFTSDRGRKLAIYYLNRNGEVIQITNPDMGGESWGVALR